MVNPSVFFRLLQLNADILDDRGLVVAVKNLPRDYRRHVLTRPIICDDGNCFAYQNLIRPCLDRMWDLDVVHVSIGHFNCTISKTD